MIREKKREKGGKVGDEKEENYKNNKTQESAVFCSFSLDETENLRPRPHRDEGRRAREKGEIVEREREKA